MVQRFQIERKNSFGSIVTLVFDSVIMVNIQRFRLCIGRIQDAFERVTLEVGWRKSMFVQTTFY